MCLQGRLWDGNLMQGLITITTTSYTNYFHVAHELQRHRQMSEPDGRRFWTEARLVADEERSLVPLKEVKCRYM